MHAYVSLIPFTKARVVVYASVYSTHIHYYPEEEAFNHMMRYFVSIISFFPASSSQYEETTLRKKLRRSWILSRAALKTMGTAFTYMDLLPTKKEHTYIDILGNVLTSGNIDL